jgi:hypothetical protein
LQGACANNDIFSYYSYVERLKLSKVLPFNY